MKSAAAQAITGLVAHKDLRPDWIISMGTNYGGAGVWPATYAPYFAEKHVFILPDNDPPGREHALLVARCLYPVAASVRVVHLPGLLEAGDVSDWLDKGRDLESLLDCCFRSPVWQPEAA